MKIMPFVLILQLIMSGVLFELSDFSKVVANITFSKWGMSAFGSTGNMNSLEHVMAIKIPEMAEMIRKQFPTDDVYAHDAGTLITAWLWSLGITVVSAVVSVVSLKIKNRDS